MRKALIVFSLIIISSLNSCSNMFGPTEEQIVGAKGAVLRVSADYLKFISTNDYKQMESLVIWQPFLELRDPPMTIQEFNKQLKAFNKYPWTPKTHPLINLDVVDINVDDDVADVSLKKYGNENSPEIKVELLWVGRGWRIMNDSLFGVNGLFSDLKTLEQMEPLT